VGSNRGGGVGLLAGRLVVFAADSPLLFHKVWSREAGVTEDQAGHPAKVFGLSFVFALLAAYAFAVLIGPAPELMSAIHQGLIVGAAFAATSFGINYQFSNKSLTLWLIDGGYHTIQFGLYGLVLGLWH
jgi:hypothetical protein